MTRLKARNPLARDMMCTCTSMHTKYLHISSIMTLGCRAAQQFAFFWCTLFCSCYLLSPSTCKYTYIIRAYIHHISYMPDYPCISPSIDSLDKGLQVPFFAGQKLSLKRASLLKVVPSLLLKHGLWKCPVFQRKCLGCSKIVFEKGQSLECSAFLCCSVTALENAHSFEGSAFLCCSVTACENGHSFEGSAFLCWSKTAFEKGQSFEGSSLFFAVQKLFLERASLLKVVPFVAV